jgi:uncharacterized protein YceK
MPYRIIALFLALLTLSACSSIKNFTVADEFEKSSRSYNQMLRWHEWGKAALAFPVGSLREEYALRIKSAGNVTVTDFRVKSLECNPEKGEAKVAIDIDYYIPPSVTIKTVEDNQKWAYIDDNGHKRWRLTTLLPEFK